MEPKQIIFIPTAHARSNSANLLKRQDVIIGIYIPNGVMRERAHELGVSYCVDALIFDRLAEAEVFESQASVWGSTYYGYSEFLISASQNDWTDALRTILNYILYPKKDRESLANVQMELMLKLKKHIPSFWQRFWKALNPENRYAIPVSGTVETVPKLNPQLLSDWKQQYYQVQNMCFCVTGEWKPAMQEELASLIQAYEVATLTKLEHSPSTNEIPSLNDIILCGRYKQVELVVAFLCRVGPEELLPGEALCRRLEDILDNQRYQDVTTRVEITIGEDSLFQIHCSVPATIAFQALQTIGTAIAHWDQEMTAMDLTELQTGLFKTYQDLFSNPEECNKFIGWNCTEGPWYDFNALQIKKTFHQKIQLDSMRMFKERVLRVENLVIYLHGAPNEIEGKMWCQRFREMID